MLARTAAVSSRVRWLFFPGGRVGEVREDGARDEPLDEDAPVPLADPGQTQLEYALTQVYDHRLSRHAGGARGERATSGKAGQGGVRVVVGVDHGVEHLEQGGEMRRGVGVVHGRVFRRTGAARRNRRDDRGEA